jgi:hypothetical protein
MSQAMIMEDSPRPAPAGPLPHHTTSTTTITPASPPARTTTDQPRQPRNSQTSPASVPGIVRQQQLRDYVAAGNTSQQQLGLFRDGS